MKKQNLIKLASAFAVVTMLGFGLHGKAYALGATSAIESVTIGSGKTTVDITMNNSGDMSGTDGNFYLFELQPYEDGIENRTDYLEKVGAGSVTKSYQLNKGSESSRLYNSYVVAVYDGSKYVPVSSQKYIINPEAVAANTTAYKTQASKKGLQIELKMLDDAFDLGVKHASTNIAFNQILGNGIDYNYNGKTYHFNKAVVEDYDKTISAFSGKDMTVTAIILNGYNEAHPELLYPNMPRRDSIFYYMFNASSKEGADTTEAIASFLAERYNGKNPKYGKVSNWIIGNEINNQQWNYVGDMDVRSYTRRYEKAFRIFYNAIKSNSSTDRVFYSLDYNWNNEINNKNKYGGKQIVDNFNSLVLEHGDIDWGLAYHPYPAPMTEPEFWDDAEKTGLIKDSFDSPIINFANLNKLTDYFAQDALKKMGVVRHIMLTEEGFTATNPDRGNIDNEQAAAFAYSYYLVDSNPYIEAYILSRQVDAPLEVRSGLSFGLWTCNMNIGDEIKAVSKRKLWNVFKYIDKAKYTLDNTDFAKSILGISKWQEKVPDFKWAAQENRR